ncbi:MAG: hypothetical protein EXQ52_01075 [Bryobacterales bacterium]|nr:hypothetical protein [Bryobacterales bacterium]
MRTRLVAVVWLVLFLAPRALECQSATAPTVRFRTVLGDIDVTLLPGSAPRTVANFLNYMNRGAFNNSIIHRSVPGFIFQGGGFQYLNQTASEIRADPPVRNEYAVSNTRGTIAMAKLGTSADSATSQWFFNLSNNNASNLNNQNGGFTVFGRVANAAGLTVMDRIATVPIPNPPIFASPFDAMPLINYTRGAPVGEQNLVMVLTVTQLDPAPAIKANGIVSASSFGAFAAAAPGSYIEIYGTDLAGTTREWAGTDFTDGDAPTLLDGVSVTVGGQPAFVNFVSPGQVNVEIPAGVPAGTAPVVVSYKGQTSASASFTIKLLAGGLLAPPSFNVNGKQYVLAIHAASGAFVSNGNIPDVPAAPAAPGETLILYGLGFGPVSPAGTPIAGKIAQGLTSLTADVQFRIGQSAAKVEYAGLAPNLVGLYQFNAVVPPNAASGDLPLEVVLAGEAVPQTLFIPVK